MVKKYLKQFKTNNYTNMDWKQSALYSYKKLKKTKVIIEVVKLLILTQKIKRINIVFLEVEQIIMKKNKNEKENISYAIENQKINKSKIQ